MQFEKELPAKPSALILLALADLEWAERNPDYAVNMGHWHSGKNEGRNVCTVCFAGAVMAKTLHADSKFDFTPFNFSEPNEIRLDVIDDFRGGNIGLACAKLDIPVFDEDVGAEVRVRITPYSDDPELFKAEMRLLAKLFKRFGH
jgi:hypothetical protein